MAAQSSRSLRYVGNKKKRHGLTWYRLQLSLCLVPILVQSLDQCILALQSSAHQALLPLLQVLQQLVRPLMEMVPLALLISQRQLVSLQLQLQAHRLFRLQSHLVVQTRLWLLLEPVLLLPSVSPPFSCDYWTPNDFFSFIDAMIFHQFGSWSASWYCMRILIRGETEECGGCIWFWDRKEVRSNKDVALSIWPVVFSSYLVYWPNKWRSIFIFCFDMLGV